MTNDQSSIWQNILMFFSAVVAWLNFKGTIKGVRLGIEIARLKKENIQLKRTITKMNHDRAGIS